MGSDSFFSFFSNLFHNDFMPHGHCYFWRPEIVWLNVISDGFIALSYYAIPLILLFFISKRKDFPFPWILAMFGAFILLCGTTHIMAIITLWDPVYRLDGLIKAATAIVSVITTIMLIPLVPLALALRSPKELEAANLKLAEANEKLHEIDRLKDNFFSNISHELRTPLTLILAPLESFLANDYGLLSDVQQKNLAAMHNNTIRLFQMVNSILDFAKISAKKIVVNREPLDIVLLTTSITQEFEPVIKQKQIQIQFNCPVARKIVNMDRYLYERILFNLLSNAVKFTSYNGSISVSLDFDKEKVILTVSDTGIGISEADQKKLFQRFQQIEGSATRRFEGTGIGLALVKEFAVILGGDVRVDSQLNKGSTFSVELSAPEGDTNTEGALKPLAGKYQKFEVLSAQTREFSETEKGTIPKVLIAEDNVELGAYIVSLLSGFAQTKHVQDGEEALEVIKTWEPNLVLLDVMMPKRDGISVCHDIKSSPETNHIPVILLTALTHRDALIRGWEAGADEYLFKPFHPKELVTRIRLLLNQAHNNNLIQDLNRKLIIAARLAGMSEVTTSILHNIGNVLNSVNVTASLLLEKLSKSNTKDLVKFTESFKVMLADPITFSKDKEKQANIILYLNTLNETMLGQNKTLIDDVMRLNKHVQYIKDIISFQQSEGPQGVLETVNLPTLLDDALSTGLDKVNDIHVIKNYHNASKAVLDKMRLHQILLHLIRNAKDSLQESQQANKELILTVQTKIEDKKEWIEIEVSDNGLGISPDNLRKIFTFGFTTKPEGLGFGLHMSALSAKKMGGELTVKSQAGKGATFSLKLPAEPFNTKNWVEIKDHG